MQQVELDFDTFASDIYESPIIGKLPIIVISGPIASGKESVAKILFKEYHYPNITYSEALRERASAKGLFPPYDRRILTEESRVAREQYGDDAVTKLALYSATLQFLRNPSPGFSIDGLRRIQEAQILRDLPLISFWWIEAEQDIRWERLKGRARPGDPSTKDEFLKWDISELESMLPIKNISSVVIDNNKGEQELETKVLAATSHIKPHRKT